MHKSQKCLPSGLLYLILVLLCCVPSQLRSQLAEGHSKFLGNITNEGVPQAFSTYWNQVTPENGGKWGVVERDRDVMDWSQLDVARDLAVANGYLLKQHTFIWGSQYPNMWLDDLSPSEQLDEIIEWIDAYADRYEDVTAFIDVVNEPLHQPAPFKDALGGDNNLYGTGWDWIVRSFELVRNRMPNAKLLINEYGIISSTNAAQDYRNIIDILNSRGLIDGIGIQCHAFNMDDVSPSTMNDVLDILAGSGLPIYISELDMNATGGDTNLQLSRYQEKFRVFWEHPAVAGITLWGYVQGAIWQTEAWLLSSGGSERPALQWLRSYLEQSSGNTHVWLEAECGIVGSLWNRPSDGAASNGEYVTIQSGNNSTGSAPSSSTGHINYDFSVNEGGNYRVWGRVITPSSSDDSFWIRMDGGSWTQWNSIPATSSWQWDDVHDSNNGGQAVNYNLTMGNHTLTVAYREDGSQLDKIYITNSGNVPTGTGSAATNCSNNQAPTANAGTNQTVTDSDGNGSESVSLNGSGSNDPDGTIVSYVWTEGGNQIATGANPSVSFSVGTHNVTLTVTDNGNATDTDNVTITVNAGGGGEHVWLEAECGTVGTNWNTLSDGNASSGQYATIQSGNNSTGSAPTGVNDRISYAFNVTEGGSYIVWGRVIAPSGSDDSFWVRMDGGSWIQWNSIDQGSSWHWDEVHDSQNGSQVVSFSLGIGSHTLDVAYREDGTQIDKLYITNSGNTPSGTGSGANNCTPINQAPTASAGSNQTVTDSDGNGSESVSLDGSGSNDPDGTIVSYVWTEGGNQIATGVNPNVSFSVGTHNVTLTVTDNGNAQGTDNVTITINAPAQNIPPTADAGSNQTVTDNDGNGSESVTLDGSGSNDPDGTIVSYVWTEGGSQIATGVNPNVSFSVGTHNVTLTVTDNDDATGTDNVTITVSAGGGGTDVWLEAECGTVGSNWNTPSDGNASNGQYATIQSGNNSTGSAPTGVNDRISYNFDVSESGSYTVWGRVIAPSGSDDSFWVRMDSGSWIQWNNIDPGSSWHWDEVHDSQNGGNVVSFSLGNGSHTLDVAYREDGTQLDKIYITNTTDTPSGQGGSADNCGGGEGTIVVRALGTSGNETIELRIDDNTVETWSLSTSFQSFTHNTSTSSGNIKVYFNDNGGENFDVQIDFIQTNGVTLQAEDQATNTGVWQNSACGGSFSEMIHCEGYIDFGTVSIGKQGGSGSVAAAEIPTGFALQQNYPNPFNPETEISYQLADRAVVRLEIYNILGNRIRTLVNSPQTAGTHRVRWNGKDESGAHVSSGVYVYTLNVVTATGTFSESRKMLLAK